MIDYLVRLPNAPAAYTALNKWRGKDDQGIDTWRLPQWCDLLPVDAYTALGTPDVLNDDGTMKSPGTSPAKAMGWWAIVSLDRDVTVPTAVQSLVKAQGAREDGLQLSAGVVGVSAVWAGMAVR